ncbi:Myrcene synthase [Forsythia ovata]|uniref:Myrcene synthase n=1 Tax=Forsythia ovata TaxID=205694 RepID=A0ABD1RZS9_9LAMI
MGTYAFGILANLNRDHLERNVLSTMGKNNCSKRIEELQENTRKALKRALDPMAAMELIDTLQWLGIAYNYDEEIGLWLNKLSTWDSGEDLHATALRFRLLRNEGWHVSVGTSLIYFFLNRVPS